MRFEKATSVLDALSGEQFEGYTRGESWNGFACPYFSFEQSQRLINILEETGQVTSYDKQADRFVCAQEDCTYDPDYYGAVNGEGLGKLYHTGAFSWAWEKIDSIS